MSKCTHYDLFHKNCRLKKSQCGNFDCGNCNSGGQYKTPKKHNYLKSEEKFHL